MASQKTDYFVHVFQALGAPLVQASLAHATASGADLKAIAQTVAELLTKSVQSGIDLGALVQIEQQGEKAESGRVVLTALAAQMIGEFYAQSKKLPEATDLQAIVDGLKTVMDLTQSFEASPEAIMRLEALNTGQGQADHLQSKIELIAACAPIVQVISSMPMGKEPKEAAKTVAEKITARTNMIIGASPDQDQHMKRDVLTALAELYVQVHKAEAQKPAPSFDQAIQDFETQADLVHALSHSIVSADEAAPAPATPPATDNPITPPPVSPPPTEQPAAPPPPPPPPVQEQPPVAPPQQPPAEDGSASSAPSNPMGFFAKKPAQEDVSPPAAPPPPPPPPVQEQPPATPTQQPPEQPQAPAVFDQPIQTPQEPPAEQPPAIVPPATDNPITPPPQEPPAVSPEQPPAEKEKPAGANPMSFFTKKDTDDDE